MPDDALTYDAIELDGETAAFSSAGSSAQITPTIFYQQNQGKLNELVDVVVLYGSRVKKGSRVDLELDKKHYRQILQGSQDFGEEKLAFSVPEFAPHSEARLE